MNAKNRDDRLMPNYRSWKATLAAVTVLIAAIHAGCAAQDKPNDKASALELNR